MNFICFEFCQSMCAYKKPVYDGLLLSIRHTYGIKFGSDLWRVRVRRGPEEKICLYVKGNYMFTLFLYKFSVRSGNYFRE